MAPHQERVVAEKAELDDKLAKLEKFTKENPAFRILNLDEQGRLIDQSVIMFAYSDVLRRRIAAFKTE